MAGPPIWLCSGVYSYTPLWPREMDQSRGNLGSHGGLRHEGGRKMKKLDRCANRDDNGHRCKLSVDHQGTHVAFGRKWEVPNANPDLQPA